MVAVSLKKFFSSRRRHTRLQGDWSSDVCSSDLSSPPIPPCLSKTIFPDPLRGFPLPTQRRADHQNRTGSRGDSSSALPQNEKPFGDVPKGFRREPVNGFYANAPIALANARTCSSEVLKLSIQRTVCADGSTSWNMYCRCNAAMCSGFILTNTPLLSTG